MSNQAPQKTKRHRKHKKNKKAVVETESADVEEDKKEIKVEEAKEEEVPSEVNLLDEDLELQDDESEAEFDPDSEDEGIEDYMVSGYHPVHIGEVIYYRYVILQKLGWGRFSTVWLAKDFKYDNYVALKIQKSAPHYLEAAYDQVQILQRAEKRMKDPEWIKSLKEYYPEKTTFTRDDSHCITLLNSFLYKGPYGNHFCFVFEIMGVNLYEIIKRYNFRGTPLHICRKIAKQVLVGLDFLHRFCGVIHTDLKPENVVVGLTKQQINEIIENGRLSESEAYQQRIKEYQEAHGVVLPELPKKKKEKEPEESVIPSQMYTKRTSMNGESVSAIQQKILQLEKQYGEKRGEFNKTKKSNMRKLIKKLKAKVQNLTNKNSQKKEQVEEGSKENPNNMRLLNFDPPQRPQNLRGPKLDENVLVKIADLGNACWTHHQFSSQIQTRQYRSPQTLLGVKYDTTADIWSFACMLYEMVTGELLFEPTKQRDFTKNEHHLAIIQQRVGKFPHTFKMSGKKSKHYFGKDGHLKHFKDIPYVSISSILVSKFRWIQSQAQAFDQFLLPMLNPCPYLRVSAQQALQSPWLNRPKTQYKMGYHQHFEYMSKIKGNVIRQGDNLIVYKDNPSDNQQANDADTGENMQNQLPIVEDTRVPISIKLIDQSFSDLGYIGYCDGLKLQELDQIPNWQFV